MKKLLLATVLAFSSSMVAQGPEGLPTLRSFDIAPGSLLDLDAGVIVRDRKVGVLQADMQFGRDGIGFYLKPLLGGMKARAGDDAPASDDWSDERIHISRRGDARVTAFLKTNHGVARVSLAIVNPYSVASASVQWVVVPPTDPVFLSAPTGLRARWQGDKGARTLHVSWSGEQSRYMVEVRTGQTLRKELVSFESITLKGLDPEGIHRITVRGLEDGAVSLPGSVIQHGPRKKVERHRVDYADRWYDDTGGMSLRAGQAATEDADVVCYLYGVYVPGGGVQKIGEGRAAFDRQAELPTEGYLPSYGRLDTSDVYAVRLADGRYGMIWLEAKDGDDLRSGMWAHTVFLPDGRRDLVAAPVVASDANGGVPTVSWQKVRGADSYRVTAAGQPAIVTKKLSTGLRGLAKGKVHDVSVVAVSQTGDESPPSAVKVSTHAFDVRIGRVSLPSQRGGFDFVTEELDGRKPVGLQLVGGAGGGQSLSFKMDGLMVPMGAREFGDLSDLKALAASASGSDGEVKNTWYCDSREDDSWQFLVFPTQGGCAMVRVVKRGYPANLEYLWVPELPK